jgi:GNAT superfamily N-acetyltransferase
LKPHQQLVRRVHKTVVLEAVQQTLRFASKSRRLNPVQESTVLHKSPRPFCGRPYYTLAVGQVTREEAPERLTKGLARHPVPIMLLARLAVDRRSQGQGVGKALLRDAMQRTVQAADIAGIRAFAVHAKDEEARSFYQKFDFTPSPTDPMHLFKDVRRIISGQ